jgi:pimeloyl-ACP methyl ester carboxylesterase
VVSEHQVVLLHGQPGSGADWEQLAGQLPGTLHVTALDRPGYGASPRPAGGFGYNARAVLADLDARGIERAVLVGHSYGGGVALSLARLAPERAEALVLLASVGPGCLTGWDRLLAAPVAGEICALTAWSLTPWTARAWLAAVARLRGRPSAAHEHVNLQIWGSAHHDHGPVWRSFLTERHARPGPDHPPAGGGPARCPGPDGQRGRPSSSAPWGARHRGRDRRVPRRPGRPAGLSVTRCR